MRKKPGYSVEELTQTLRRVLGNDEATFQGEQGSIVQTILSGRDILVILPTGTGKSVCYQVPAMLLPGITLVISPLIALMQEQAERLHERGLPVACLSSDFILDKDGPHLLRRKKVGEEDESESTRSRKLRNQVYLDATHGKYKIIYLTPERLRTGAFIRFAQRVEISLIAVDEAHCISLWGYDFRPRYLEISRLMKRIGYHPVIAAFTATAPHYVQDDIITYLEMKGVKKPEIPDGGQERSNLKFEVWWTGSKRGREHTDTNTNSASSQTGEGEPGKDEGNDKEKPSPSFGRRLRRIIGYLRNHPRDSGFIYCNSVNDVNAIHTVLKSKGFSVTRYYANLDKDRKHRAPKESKRRNQNAFISGKKRIMVSTSALGMGIDKKNVRFVIHFNMPVSMEDYYQQAGRAGRDGKPARCILCYSGEEDMRSCKALLRDSMINTELSKEATEIRKEIARQRLVAMQGYARMAGAKSEELKKEILAYFGSGEDSFEPEISSEQAKWLDSYVRHSIHQIDVLYVNRTKIAQELRKGNRQGTDLLVGHAIGNRSAPTVSYSVEGPELSYFDLMVADAVYTLMKHRVPAIYARNVMELLSGVDGLTLRPERKAEVESSIRKLMQTQITIDRTHSMHYGFVYDDERRLNILQGAFLPLEEKRNGFSYDPMRLPPLYQYAEIINGQFFSLPTRELCAVFGKTEQKASNGQDRGNSIVLPSSIENLSIVHYILCRIGSMNHFLYNKGQTNQFRRAFTAPIIRLDTMVKVLRIELPEEPYYQRRKLKNLWEKMLAALRVLLPEEQYKPDRDAETITFELIKTPKSEQEGRDS